MDLVISGVGEEVYIREGQTIVPRDSEITDCSQYVTIGEKRSVQYFPFEL